MNECNLNIALNYEDRVMMIYKLQKAINKINAYRFWYKVYILFVNLGNQNSYTTIGFKL